MNEILQFDHTDETSFVNRPPSFFWSASQPFFVLSRNATLQRYLTTQRGVGSRLPFFRPIKTLNFESFLKQKLSSTGETM